MEHIFNLASPASPIHYQHDPVQITNTRVREAINVLGLAKRVKQCVFKAFTSEVYGDPEEYPQPESYLDRVNPTELSMRKLAENVLKLTGSQSKLFFKPLPEADPRQRQPDLTLAKAKLDWNQKVPPEDGLKEIIAHCGKRPDV